MDVFRFLNVIHNSTTAEYLFYKAYKVVAIGYVMSIEKKTTLFSKQFINPV